MLRGGSNGREMPRNFANPDRRSGGTGDPVELAVPATVTSADLTVCQQSMATLIADEIIPRLIAAHRGDESNVDPAGVQDVLIALNPVRLADEAVATDAGRLLEIAEAAMTAGLSFEALLVDVMAPAARILGERWEDDRADFVEVTLGLWRLQELVHLLAAGRQPFGHDYAGMSERRVLCAVAPDDTHSFGSVLLEEMFRRAGWIASAARGLSSGALLAEVRQGSFELIALTVSVERNSAVLAGLVSALKAASRNPGVRIMVGGPVFVADPGLADAIGADATAPDARTALKMAEMLVGQMLVGRTDSRPASAGSVRPRPGLQPG